MVKVLASAVLGVLSFTYMAPIWAQADHSAFELAMLPDYCQARLGHDEQVKSLGVNAWGRTSTTCTTIAVA